VTVNPLVAGPVVTSTAVSGLGVVESVSDLCSSLRSGSWVAAGLAGVGAALDVAASVIDPLGSLIGAGLGWVMDHLEPLKGWLNDLAGDAGAVLGFAGTWDNIAAAMSGASGELTRVVRADLELMSGDSIDAYRAYAQGLAAKIGSTGESAAAMSSALQVCAQVVQAVHDVVRDTLAQLAGSIISWAAEAVFTLGLATPVIVGQVSTRVSALATRIGKHVTDVVHTAKNLSGLLDTLKDLLRRLVVGARRGAPDAAPRSRSHAVPTPTKKPLPDLSHLDDIRPRVGHEGNLDEWAEQVSVAHGELTPGEVKAIYRYTTDDGYQEMNGYLRNPSSYSPQDAARIQRDIDDAVAGMDKLPQYSGKTYRGTDMPHAVLDTWQPGAIVKDEAFWSTTTDADVGLRFRNGGEFFVTITDGTGVDIQALSHYGDEAEILVRPGTSYEVLTRDWNPSGYWDLTAREVPR